MDNKKIKLVVLSSTAAIAALAIGAFALFTDTDSGSAGAKAGNVTVDLSNPSLSNSGNINPGDNDETIPESYIPDPDDPLYQEDEEGNPIPVPVSTTPHDLTFTVENTGNKSIRTRQTLLITCTSADGKTQLDPSVFSLLIEKGLELGSEDGVKLFVLEDGSEVEAKDLKADDKVLAVKYVLVSDVFDGVGASSEKEEKSTVKSVADANGMETAAKDYTYLLKMDKEALNDYQGANITIDIVVDAIQYRNTGASDWETVSTATVTGKLTNTPEQPEQTEQSEQPEQSEQTESGSQE